MKKALISPIAILAVFTMGLAFCLSCGDDSTDSPPCLTLTAVGNGNGNIGIEPSSNCYYRGNNVTLTATPDGGWQFDNWTGDVSSTDNPVIVTFGETNIAITANFSEIAYTLTTGVSPANSGTVQVAPDQETYDHGDTVTLTAVPADDYEFNYWSGLPAGHDSVGNPLEIIMEDNYSITANFIYDPSPTTATISGTVNWPGHNLSHYTSAYADTLDAGNTTWTYAETDVNPLNGSYSITIEISDPITLYFEAWDDVNYSQEYDAGDGWGFYDLNGNGGWDTNDNIVVSPGDNITGVDITLQEIALGKIRPRLVR